MLPTDNYGEFSFELSPAFPLESTHNEGFS